MPGGPPWHIFGRPVFGCHGLPFLVFVLTVSFTLTAGLELASQSVKPVELTAIWTEPRAVTIAAIMAQPMDEANPERGAATQLYKTGIWHRLCPVEARQTFTDEQGNILVAGSFHEVDTKHAKLGSFERKHRGLVIPKALAKFGPGIYRMKLENTGQCLPEKLLGGLISIHGMTAETTFEIVP